MIYQTHGSKAAKSKKGVNAAAEEQSVPKVPTDQELSVAEEALVLGNPTPEEEEAFREYLRKNGGGLGDP